MEKSILIVEDEEYVEVWERMLKREGFNPIIYSSGLEAVESIENGLKYSLALVDLSLPRISGEDIIALSKKLNPNVPVISISGYAKDPSSSINHIIKPVGNKELIDIIKGILEK